MKVNCPGCKGAYKVEDHRVPEAGLKMRCPKCKTAFLVKKKKKSLDPPSPIDQPGGPAPQKRPPDTKGAAPPPVRNKDEGSKGPARPPASPPGKPTGADIGARLFGDRKKSPPSPKERPPLKKSVSPEDVHELDFSDIEDDIEINQGSAEKEKPPLGRQPIPGSGDGPAPERAAAKKSPLGGGTKGAGLSAGLKSSFSIDDAIDASFSKRGGGASVSPPPDTSDGADAPLVGDEEFDLTSQIPDEPPYEKIKLPPLKAPEDRKQRAPRREAEELELSTDKSAGTWEPPAAEQPKPSIDVIDLPEIPDSLDLNQLSAPGTTPERRKPVRDEIDLAEFSLDPPPPAGASSERSDDFELSMPGDDLDDSLDLSLPEDDAPIGSGGELDLSLPEDDGPLDSGGELDVSLNGNGSSDVSSDMPRLSGPDIVEIDDEPGAPAAEDEVDERAAPGSGDEAPLSFADVGSRFGEIDLPPLADNAPEMSLPEMSEISGETASVSEAPMPLSEDELEAELENVKEDGSLPPLSISNAGKLPLPDDLLGDMPSPADLVGGGLPPLKTPPATPSSTRRVEGSGSTDFGEISLAPGGGSGGDAAVSAPPDLDTAEFDGFPTESPSREERRDTGPLDLAADPLDLRRDREAAQPVAEDGLTEAAPRPATAFEGRRKWERQSRKSKIVLLVALVVLVAGGSALTFTPLGPFGAHYLFQLIPKPIDEAAVAQAKEIVAKRLKEDNLHATREAIREAREASEEWTGSEDLRLLVVYLCYFYQIRFEPDKKLDHHATRFLGSVKLDESTSPYAPLAKAAQFLRFSRPVKMTAPWAASLKKLDDGMAILTEVYLTENTIDQAVATATALDNKEKSSRSGYLLARALLRKNGNRQKAVERLRKIVESDKRHLGAVLLLSNAMIDVSPRDPDQIRELASRVLTPEGGTHPIASEVAEAHAVLARLFLAERKFPEASAEVALAEKQDPENVSMLISKGRIALFEGNYTEAEVDFNKATANAPRNVEAKLGKVETDIRTDELSNAEKALSALAPTLPNHPRAHYLMGEVNLALKKTAEAEEELKKAIELDDGLLEAYVALSMLYLGNKQNQEAMDILDKASEKVPGSSLIKKTLARAHAARGDFASAIIELDKALALNSEDTSVHFLMAEMYLKMGSLEDADRSLQEVAKRDPDYPGLALAQGLLMERSGQVEKALAAYKKALDAHPDDINLKLRVGAAAQIVGDLETAKKMLSEVLEQRPDSAEASFYLGETFRLAGQAAEAVTSLKKACMLDEENPRYHLRHGMALSKLGETKKAMDEFDRALKLDENLAEAYIRMGQIRLQQGAPRDAIYIIEKGLALDSTFADAFSSIAEAFDQVGNKRSSVYYYQKAVGLAPNDAELNFKLGLAELTVDGSKEAVPPLVRAVKLASETRGPMPEWLPEALYRLGVAQRKLGKRQEAVTTFKHYLEVAPENAIDRSQVVSHLDELAP